MPEHSDRQAGARRITRVYTRKGDQGTTYLVGDRPIRKDHPRIRAYGTADELQVAIGAALDTLGELDLPIASEIAAQLADLQNLLCTVSGELATCLEDYWEGMPRIGDRQIADLEKIIDRFNTGLPDLKDFLLPGGHRAVSALHLCRVVCRRCECEVAALAVQDELSPHVLPFINRLSDLFYVMARRMGEDLRREGLAGSERIWLRHEGSPAKPE